MSLARRGAGAVVAAATAAAGLVAAGSWASGLFTSGGAPISAPAASRTASSGAARPSPAGTAPSWARIGGRWVCMRDCRDLGVALGNRNSLPSFVHATGVHPQLVEVYRGFGSPFPPSWVASIAAAGQIPLIQINPYRVSLTGISAGKHDSYLSSYAAAVRRFGRPVALSFGHEMNGDWYPWGCRHTSASAFVAAYRHVVDVIRRAGARNVIWLWTANVEAPGDCPIAGRYPGDRYVTWVGLDGYLREQGRTFSGIFGRSLVQIHRFTDKPILLAETGVLLGVPGAPRRILSLFAGGRGCPRRDRRGVFRLANAQVRRLPAPGQRGHPRGVPPGSVPVPVRALTAPRARPPGGPPRARGGAHGGMRRCPRRNKASLLP